MTLYDSQIDGALTSSHAQAPGPQTHAMIIGVGYYHHLPGGQGATVREPMDLEQLTSPPKSARAFATWVLEELRNTQAPLGSLELLISPPSEFILPNGVVRMPSPATMSEVQLAFDRWYQRCNSDARNVAIFYFCGHGVMRRNLALLAQDYGARALTPFQTAIDINVTWEGMARCAAQTQCYFIDSCRQASWTMQKQLDDPAVSLISPVFGVANDRDAPRFMATGPARSAYGMSDGVTMFTDILIESLKRGARKNRGRWVVTTQRLSEALCCAMPDLAEDDPTNPTRKLVRQVLGAISEYEKSLIVLKLRGARVRQRAKEGRCEGAKPYGFYEGEEAIVERMKALRSSGMGFDRIAAQLNADGLKPRGGERWHGLVVNRILTGKGRAAEAKNA